MIDLVRSGRDSTELAREYEASGNTIRNWVGQADRQEGRRDTKPQAGDIALVTAEWEEFVRLRRENKQLRAEKAWVEVAPFI